MGIIRKTVSIGTIGIVPFRSKREQLRRAEKAHREAEAELAGEHAARIEVDRRLAEAEKRARQAELLALQQAKKAEVASGRRRDRRREARKHAKEAIEDLVASASPAVEERAKELSRRSRKAAKRAAKKAEAAAEEARKQAKKQGRRAAGAGSPGAGRRSPISPRPPPPRQASWSSRAELGSADRVGEVLAQVADEVDEEAAL